MRIFIELGSTLYSQCSEINISAWNKNDWILELLVLGML